METAASATGDTELLRRGLLHELFERQARVRGNDVAVACGDSQMTYGELERASNRLARHFASSAPGRTPASRSCCRARSTSMSRCSQS